MLMKENIFLLLLLWYVIAIAQGIYLDVEKPPHMYAKTSSVFHREKLWNTNLVTVSFINGNCDQHSAVRRVASEWTPYSNIDFIFIDQPDKGNIRVSFNDTLGSWSCLGTDSRDVSKASMNFGWIERRTILHEFGHALGLDHEQQNPIGGIKWNETAVYERYGGSPSFWSPEKIKFNVIDMLNKDQTNGVYDPNSIMHYAIDADLTINKCCGTKQNNDLSTGDKHAIQKLYEKFKPSRDALMWAVKWNGIGRSNNRAHNYAQSWRGIGISQTKKKALISKIHCQQASEVYAGLLSRPNPKVSAYGTCMVGVVKGMPTFWVNGMYGAVGHSGYPKNPVSKDGTGHLRNCYNEHKLTGLCFYSNVAERAKQTLLYAIENDVCTDYPNL
ncbi:unnamed protein product [Rotaria magnacalcarata]|uniref:Peptidase M12A domain-containing protein n=1 Tax=Rotaria magnacalcarata TaxID=392030 RepID=A0A816L2K9_9BILA|nr:unnamed protein product [Rotaria magnacalcarata]